MALTKALDRLRMTERDLSQSHALSSPLFAQTAFAVITNKAEPKEAKGGWGVDDDASSERGSLPLGISTNVLAIHGE